MAALHRGPETTPTATTRSFSAMRPPMPYRPSRALLRVLVLAVLSTAAPAVAPLSAAAQAPTFVTGTGVGLVPPKGMRPARTFSGFESPDTGASILVAELPAEAYPQLLKTFTPADLAAGGLQAKADAVDWKVAGGQGGRLIRGTQTAHGALFRKWVLLAKGPSNTVMLSVQVPDAKSAALPDATVETALKTVSLKVAPSLDEQASALPFKIGDRVNFRPVRVLAGSGLLLTDGPRDVIPDASQPVVIVASALGSVAKDKAEREALARQAFATIAGVSDVSIVSQKMEERAGATWSRIEGTGTYRDSQEALSTLQIIRFDDKGGYIRVVAIARTLHHDNVIPRVDMLAASVTPR